MCISKKNSSGKIEEQKHPKMIEPFRKAMQQEKIIQNSRIERILRIRGLTPVFLTRLPPNGCYRFDFLDILCLFVVKVKVKCRWRCHVTGRATRIDVDRHRTLVN